MQETLRVDSVLAQSRKKVTHRRGQSLTQGFLTAGHKMRRKSKLDGGILRRPGETRGGTRVISLCSEIRGEGPSASQDLRVH